MDANEKLLRLKEKLEKENITWCLYGASLLCAVGYKEIPEDQPITIAANKNFKTEENIEVTVIDNLKTTSYKVGENIYPVLENYEEYLNETFLDWQQGLFDEIGCGLTKEEKESLKLHQQNCKEALAIIEEIARKFNLEYYLLAGSVLGAVRHKGFIPWDDDIDIGVPIEALEAFEKAIRENLPEKFTLKESGAYNPYPRMFSKICCDGRCCIDIWHLVPTFNGGLRSRITWVFARLLTKAHYIHIGYPVPQYFKLAKFFTLFLNDKAVMALSRFNERKYQNRKNADCYFNLYSIYSQSKETIKKTWLQDKARLDFEGINIPVVGCTEEYLTHLYGDYMRLPKPWKRASRHFERF